MNSEKLKLLLEQGMPNSQAEISGDDHTHFYATVISDEFTGKSLLQRQRQVYACVDKELASGELHALSLKTYTKQEWEERK